MGVYTGELAGLSWHEGNDHEILPEPGSARRERDGEPARLTSPADYPVTAVRLSCGLPIRCERWFLCSWVHIKRFSNPEGS